MSGRRKDAIELYMENEKLKKENARLRQKITEMEQEWKREREADIHYWSKQK